MGYSAEVVRRARDRLAQAREDRASEDRQHLAEAYERVPRIREIDRELRMTMAQAAMAAFQAGTDGKKELEAVRDKNLTLQQERARLVEENFEEGFLDETPICDKCGGTGYIGAEMCECLRELCRQEQKKELAVLTGGKESFSQFRLDYYSDFTDTKYGASPRTIMERNFQNCRRYATTFSANSGNLLFVGGTGLGKTFLSACIARTVSESGFSVVYDTAGNIFAQFELKKFQREQGTTYLFIAHDLSIVRFISDRIGVIYKGDIVEIAEAEELFDFPLHPYTRSLLSAIPIPDPILEKNKVLFTYDPSVHDYSEDKPELVDIGNNHFVYGNKKEIEEYKALRAKNVPIKSITIRDENEPPKQTPKKEASPEEIHMAPARDTGSFWYNFLGFLLPLLSLLGAHIFRTHNYIRNYKALKKGAIVGLVFRAVLIGIFALLLVLAVI